jgi:hypothetical protein
MTGDVTGAVGSAFGRATAHFAKNPFSNALRKNLRRHVFVDVEDCLSLDFYAYGPVYSLPEDHQNENRATYDTLRAQVAALEKCLWYRMHIAGYHMLNAQPGATASMHASKWRRICAAFQQYFPDLQAS